MQHGGKGTGLISWQAKQGAQAVHIVTKQEAERVLGIWVRLVLPSPTSNELLPPLTAPQSISLQEMYQAQTVPNTLRTTV